VKNECIETYLVLKLLVYNFGLDLNSHYVVKMHTQLSFSCLMCELARPYT